MLQPKNGFALIKNIKSTGPFQEVEDNENVGEIVDAENFDVGVKVYYIPHSKLKLDTEFGTFYAIPETDIVAVSYANPQPNE